MNLNMTANLLEHLTFVYGEHDAQMAHERIMELVSRFRDKKAKAPGNDPNYAISEKDVILITYGDFVRSDDNTPLQTLAEFLRKNLEEKISIVHVLPFYPYSSDDGFSVIDYRLVNPELGSWEDIHALSNDYKLMFDAVINHISQESLWFKGFVDGDARYDNYFITEADTWDLSKVVRPRTSKLLTEVETVNGKKKVWTTFSADQVDLNYQNPKVFIEIIDLLLFYILQGASVIRLDAIAYLWKESGTTCIHLPQTHHLIKAMRLVVDMVAPEVILITETNVPHEENIRYFGEIDEATGETDQAHMVYQFPLAPLVLHTFMVGSTDQINAWIEGFETSGLFMNFIASHDGIGIMPAIGLIDEQEVDSIVTQVKAHGGLVSYKSNPDGSERVYELNTTLYDALNDPKTPDPRLDIPRYIASQVIMISLAGVPGIYFHSLFGSRNAHDHYKKTGRMRSINRKGFRIEALEGILTDPTNIHCQVFNQYQRILQIRKEEPAFHPRGRQNILRLSDDVFALERESLDSSSRVLVLVNVTEKNISLEVDLDEMQMNKGRKFVDLMSGKEYPWEQRLLKIALEPYQSVWLKAK